MKWRVIPGQTLAYRCWDDEAVLYNDLTGATHLLGPVALCVLDALRAAPADRNALSSAILAQFDIDSGSLAEELVAVLDGLARLDLIEPSPC